MPVAAILAAIGISLVPTRTVEWSSIQMQPMVQMETAQALEAAPIQIDVHALAHSEAKKYGLNAEHFDAVIACESLWDPSMQSLIKDSTGPNGREDSWGLAQIHLPDHKEITRAQAQDPVFALEFMAREWSAGNAHAWTCWRSLFMPNSG